MEKRMLFIMQLFTLLPFMANAQVIDQQTACKNVKQFLQSGIAACRPSQPLEAADLQLAYATPGADAPEVYVFNLPEKGGFVVASGDERAHPILGFAEQGAFSESDMPCCLKWLLGEYERQICFAREHRLEAPANIIDTREDIPALVQSQWNQYSPYNGKCPIDPVTNQRCITGCVATAMAQILYYHQWPERGTGEHSYVWTHNSGEEKTLSANFGATQYHMSQMRDSYDYDDVDDNLATLLYHCGVSVDMNYSSSSSSAYCSGAEFPKYFGFSNRYFHLYPDYMTEEELFDRIYYELEHFRPLLYCGQDDNGGIGHEFICDGYHHGGYLHFNFGWGGWADNYFRPTAINSGIGNYNSRQDIIGGLMPKPDIVTIDGIDYELSDDEAFLVRGQASGRLVIPATISHQGRQYQLIGIDAKAFYANEAITSVTIPSVPNTLSDSCFADCPNLKELIIEDADKPLELWDAFNNTPVERLYMGRNLTGSFNIARFLKETEIGPHVTEICDRFFYNSAMTSIRIPASVKTIGNGAFSYCSLQSIEVDEDSPYFASLEGVLYNKQISQLVAYPYNRRCGTFVVPSSVVRIGAYAFDGISSIDSLIINEGTEVLSYGSLEWTSFKYISFPATLKRIIDYGCNYLYVQQLDLHGATPPIMDENSLMIRNFEHVAYVPEGTLETWKNAPGWKGVNLTEYPLELDNLFYSKINDSELMLNGGKTVGELIIPSVVERNGKQYTVTEIKSKAFNNNNNITAIYIPASVKKVGMYAFYYTGAKKLTIADSPLMLETGSYAFSGDSLREAYIGRSWKCDDEYNDAIISAWNLRKIVLGEQVTSLPDYALTYTYIDSLRIPASVQTMGRNCMPRQISYIELHPDNQYFVMDNKALLTADKTRLIKYLRNVGYYQREYTMPPTVKTIDDYGFADANLDSIAISEQLEEVGNYCFLRAFNSNAKATLRLPATLRQISSWAFRRSYAARFEVDPANSFFSSRDGMILSKQQDKLIAAPTIPDGPIVVPEGVRTIASGTFEYTRASSICLPRSLQLLENYAFQSLCTDSVIVLSPEPPFSEWGGVRNMGTSYSYWDGSQGVRKSNDINVYIPQGTLSAYREAEDWKTLSNYVELPSNEMAHYEALGIKDELVVPTLSTGITYDLNGRKHNGLRPGLNIIKMSDGCTRKLIKR